MPQRKPWRETEFTRYLDSHSEAKRAINDLSGDNCSRERLILILRAASDPSRKQNWNRFVQEWVSSKRRAWEEARRLERASDELRQFASSPVAVLTLAMGEAGDDRKRKLRKAFGKPAPFGFHHEAGHALALADAMERQARRLRQWSGSPIAMALRGLSFRTVWKHLPLACAAQMVKRPRGHVPWGDLAYSLEAVAEGYGVQDSISPDALRKEYNAFIRSRAGKAFRLSAFAELLLSLPDRKSVV